MWSSAHHMDVLYKKVHEDIEEYCTKIGESRKRAWLRDTHRKSNQILCIVREKTPIVQRHEYGVTVKIQQCMMKCQSERA